MKKRVLLRKYENVILLSYTYPNVMDMRRSVGSEPFRLHEMRLLRPHYAEAPPRWTLPEKCGVSAEFEGFCDLTVFCEPPLGAVEEAAVADSVNITKWLPIELTIVILLWVGYRHVSAMAFVMGCKVPLTCQLRHTRWEEPAANQLNLNALTIGDNTLLSLWDAMRS